MIRNRKALGLVSILIVALGAIGASNASAARFTVEPGTIITGNKVSGTPPAIYKGDFPEVRCTQINWPGEVRQVTTSGGTVDTVLTLRPEFVECESGGFKRTVEATGCDFDLFASGTLNVKCPTGKQIDINVSELCTVTIKPQEAVPKVAYTSDPNDPKSLIADISSEGLQYEEHGLLCASQNVLTKNGSFSTQVTMTAETGLGVQVPLTLDTP
jgi:hypothetical protein